MTPLCSLERSVTENVQSLAASLEGTGLGNKRAPSVPTCQAEGYIGKISTYHNRLAPCT